MIPISNIHGQIVGFGGRILEEQVNLAKYMNSPQTPLYDKSRTVFGLDKAKQDIRKEDSVVLVEGYMDYLASYQSGVKNIVATSGTALTADQIKLIKRFTQHFIFSFDTDTAGSQATMRGVELALREGVNAKVVVLPKNEDGTQKYKDPDECVRQSPEEWRVSIASAIPFLEYSIQKVLEQGFSDGFAKKTAIRDLLKYIILIPDAIEKDYWIKKIAESFDTSSDILWSELKKAKDTTKDVGGRVVEKQPNPQKKSPASHVREQHLLSLLVLHPKLIDVTKGKIAPEMWQEVDNRGLYEYLEKRYSNPEESPKQAHFEDFIGKLELVAAKEFENIDEKGRSHLVQTIVQQIKDEYIRNRTEELRILMQQAEETGDNQAAQEYTEEFSKLYRQ